jgi:DNA-binding transcriptional MerR regulator
MARRLGVTQRWLREQSDTGAIPCIRAEGRYLYAADSVERLLTQRAARAVARQIAQDTGTTVAGDIEESQRDA